MVVGSDFAMVDDLADGMLHAADRGWRRPDDRSKCGKLLMVGADKVSVNTAALEAPQLIREIRDRFGSQCAVVAIDALGASAMGPTRVFTHSGTRPTGKGPAYVASVAEPMGAGEILPDVD